MQEACIIRIPASTATFVIEETYDIASIRATDPFDLEGVLQLFLQEGMHFTYYQAFSAHVASSQRSGIKLRFSCPWLLVCDTHQEAFEIRARLVEQSRGRVEIGRPLYGYRERLKTQARGEGKFILQTASGGSSYGHVVLDAQPEPTSEEVVLESQVDEKIIPALYMPAIVSAVKEATIRGGMSGYPLIGMRITVTGGSYHEVDSNARGYRYATMMAMWNISSSGEGDITMQMR